MTVLDSQGEGMVLTDFHRGDIIPYLTKAEGVLKRKSFSDAEFCFCSVNLIFHLTEIKATSSAGSV